MSPLGKAKAIPYAIEHCPMDEFENAIRKVGVVAACEWFGHQADSDFTEGAIATLVERSREGEKA